MNSIREDLKSLWLLVRFPVLLLVYAMGFAVAIFSGMALLAFVLIAQAVIGFLIWVLSV